MFNQTNQSMIDYKSLQEEIVGRFLQNPNAYFTTMEYTRKGKFWTTKRHLSDATIVGAPNKNVIYCNSGVILDYRENQRYSSVIDYDVKTTSKTWYEAFRYLAKLYNVSIPEDDGTASSHFANQERRTQAIKDFTAALWSGTSEANEVLDFIRSRNWTDEEIIAGQIGYVSTELRDKYKDIFCYSQKTDEGKQTFNAVGTIFRLIFPYQSSTFVYGYKLREIVEGAAKAIGLQKYINTPGLSVGSSFYGLSTKPQDVTIVEGELDALHAQLKGATNVVATNGNAVKAQQVTDAIRRGANKFTLLFDHEESGRGTSFILPSIEQIRQVSKDVAIYVADFPNDAVRAAYEKNHAKGKEGKLDLDEYLADHTIEQYEQILHNAVSESEYKFNLIASKYSGLRSAEPNNHLTYKQEDDYYKECDVLLTSDSTTPGQRERIYKLMQEATTSLNLDKLPEGYQDHINKRLEYKANKQRRQDVTNAHTQAGNLLRDGKVNEALKVMQNVTQEVKVKAQSKSFDETIKPSSIQELREQAREIVKGIPTGYDFRSPNKAQHTRFTLRPGLTFISGATGHGKTSFVNNIALNIALQLWNVYKAGGKLKSVLYFTYEVSKFDILIALLNLFCNDDLINPGEQDDAIIAYLEDDPTTYKEQGYHPKFYPTLNNYQRRERFAKFEENVRKFDNMLKAGVIVVCEENYLIENLSAGIAHYVQKYDTAFVCIDYTQLLYSENTRDARHEQIKRIVNEVLKVSKRFKLPYLLASQFNRSVTSPLHLVSTNAGEGGDIERIADTHIGIYNLKELGIAVEADTNASSNRYDLIGKCLSRAGYTCEIKPGEAIDGKIFVRLMKRRKGYYPIDVVLNWNGVTRRIEPNDEEFKDYIEQGAVSEGTIPGLRPEPQQDAREIGLARYRKPTIEPEQEDDDIFSEREDAELPF